MKPADQAHVEGTLELHGLSRPVPARFSACLKVFDNYHGSGRFRCTQISQLAPGTAALAELRFDRPGMIASSLWEGREIEVTDRIHVLGKFTINRIYDETLRATRESYNPKLGGPAFPRWGSTYTLFIHLTLYLALAALLGYQTYNVYAPCVSSFEGSCGFGKVFAAVGSIPVGLLLAVLGYVLKRGMELAPHTERFASSAGKLLIGAPCVIVVFTVSRLF